MILNQVRGVVNISTASPACPRCYHRIIYHVTGKDDMVNPNKQTKATLTGCFVSECERCPNYVGGI